MKIDTDRWKEFSVHDFFDVLKGRKKLSNRDINENGFVPVYSSTKDNNGILGYTTMQAEYHVDIGTPFFLIFGDHTKSMFIADRDFNTMDNVKVLKPHIFNQYIIRFITTVWAAAIPDMGYARHWSVAVKSGINLPVDDEGKPDWQYMENYMKNIETTVGNSLKKLKSVNAYTPDMIDTSNWKDFSITDFFELSLPQGDLQVKKVVDGDIPLITPSNFNNGLLQKISAKSRSTLYHAYSLTVDMFGNAYFQEEDFFVTAHGHVNVLIPKIKMNKYIGWFIAATIKKMFLNKYSFADMCTQKVLKKEVITLPTDNFGKPNWNYMEAYMKKMEKYVKDKISILS